MTLTKTRNPFFPSVLNDLFENNYLTPQSAKQKGLSIPAVNIKENENNYIVEMASPGMKKEDFKINLEADVLSISAELNSEKEENNERFTRKEFSFSSFHRDFTLPETADTDNITANYFDGILNITIAKKEEAKPKPAKLIEIK